MAAQDAFEQKKKAILSEIDSTQPDLSPKGTIDELCLPIIDLINASANMVTTSSCSGRVSVFLEGTKLYNGEVKIGGKGQGGKWLYVTHDRGKVIGWLDELRSKSEFAFELSDNKIPVEQVTGSTRYILYKYEPFILHVKCRDFQAASKLYNAAMSCGFRESGIGSNNLVAIRINIKLDVPIGYLDEDSDTLKLFVSPEYVSVLDSLSLSKFDENTRKMQALYDRIERELSTPAPDSNSKVDIIPIETKEERRERKKREGMERQRQLKGTQNVL
ncbi:AHL_G0019810.mRNA.1.CDS.1 [Saccharomyces cerevisiae]|nr:Tyw3p [Saccharomyces cerevisiae YJM1078]AJR78062.1 Tyw3p [Saccharomyces cerevisiae YJM248]AJR97779.1 Tyw3p [Saccharomyces cerevisiae YJM1252]CAI4459292.1 CPG_1a_G0019730.mRNA.1.CDS.1 [Saccharomyces cerevisiae]CAI4476379.1 AIE_G0019750.mRNA.1.CDS.1 [Saccharomyces cerevisiae]